MEIFKNEKFGEVRTVLVNGDPWFLAADICSFFNVTNRNRIMQVVDDDDKGGTQIDTPGGKQTATIVSESGLYAMLFALQPTKARGVDEERITERQEKLRTFKRWITHDVIPSIRKHGAYMTETTLESCLNNPDFAIGLLTATRKKRGFSVPS